MHHFLWAKLDSRAFGDNSFCAGSLGALCGRYRWGAHLEIVEVMGRLLPHDGERCVTCGQQRPCLFAAPIVPCRPWRLRCLADVEQYVATLPNETREWVLAFFVDDECRLLSVETMARGSVSSVRFSIGDIIVRGRAVGATGFVLVHNHPSGDPTPTGEDIAITVRLAHVARECEMPMLTHVVVANGGMRTVGFW